MISKTGNHQRAAVSGQRSAAGTLLNAIRYTLNAEQGFTLIEVLTAVSILAIGIVGVLQAYAGSISTLDAAQFSVNAVNVLKAKMNEVEILYKEEESPPTGDSGEEGDFIWEWSVSSTGTEGLKALNLTVSHKVNPRTFTINTYVVEKEEEEL